MEAFWIVLALGGAAIVMILLLSRAPHSSKNVEDLPDDEDPEEPWR